MTSYRSPNQLIRSAPIRSHPFIMVLWLTWVVVVCQMIRLWENWILQHQEGQRSLKNNNKTKTLSYFLTVNKHSSDCYGTSYSRLLLPSKLTLALKHAPTVFNKPVKTHPSHTMLLPGNRGVREPPLSFFPACIKYLSALYHRYTLPGIVEIRINFVLLEKKPSRLCMNVERRQFETDCCREWALWHSPPPTPRGFHDNVGPALVAGAWNLHQYYHYSASGCESTPACAS